MHGSTLDTAFTAGAIVGAVLVATILVVPLVRYVALVAATSAIAALYLHGGVPELVVWINGLQGEIVSKPTFSAGVIAGTLVALIGLGITRRRAAG